MKKPLDEIFESVRGELERGFKDAVTQIDQRARKDFQEVSARLKKLKDEELLLVERKFVDMRDSIQSGEAFRPYMAALNAAIKAYREVKTRTPGKAASKKKVSKKKKGSKKKFKSKVAKKTSKKVKSKSTKRTLKKKVKKTS